MSIRAFIHRDKNTKQILPEAQMQSKHQTSPLKPTNQTFSQSYCFQWLILLAVVLAMWNGKASYLKTKTNTWIIIVVFRPSFQKLCIWNTGFCSFDQLKINHTHTSKVKLSHSVCFLSTFSPYYEIVIVCLGTGYTIITIPMHTVQKNPSMMTTERKANS